VLEALRRPLALDDQPVVDAWVVEQPAADSITVCSRATRADLSRTIAAYIRRTNRASGSACGWRPRLGAGPTRDELVELIGARTPIAAR
jgi:hypothetical protein